MKNLYLAGVWGLTVYASSALVGCNDQANLDDEESIGTAEDELFVRGARIWRQLSIPVCWENPTTANAKERGWVSDALTNTWESATRVEFTGWGACSSGSTTGIRIRIEDTKGAPHCHGVGRDVSGMVDGMSLNFTFNHWSPVCKATREACIRSIAVHEFGHALGFSHEQNRSDAPSTCTEPKDTAASLLGDTLSGPWDADSVMNYCNPEWNNGGRISAGDTKYARQYYGNPLETSSRRDAVNWGNGKLYFFNKSEFTRYDIAKNRADSGYPKPIVGNWNGWPTTWSTGVDAAVNWGNGKVYFFRGAQYLRFDIAKDKVDVAPAAISTLFSGWPANWTSVDAAVRWNNGRAYFFRGSEYLQIVLSTRAVDLAPRKVSGDWPGLFAGGISYVFEKGTKAYFFSGLQHERYDMVTDKVDGGYPLPIVGYWPGFNF